MLIKCPECGLQVSDKAISCPHCGYVVQPKMIKRMRKNNLRRKRLPNGFGQITELKGRALKKPFRAMVTVGKNENGRPICKLLRPEAYFETYNDAYTALIEYNKSPFDVRKDMTVQELFDLWYKDHKNTVSHGRCIAINSSWKYAHGLYDIKIRDIKPIHIKETILNSTIENGEKVRHVTENAKKDLRGIFCAMFDLAVEQELVEKNYARMINLSKQIDREAKEHHRPLTQMELDILKTHVADHEFIDMVLIQCYSGWRPGELLALTVDDINFEAGYMTGGMKTKAGKDRLVPIHPYIEPLLHTRYKDAKANGALKLFNRVDGKKQYGPVTYKYYLQNFTDLLEKFDLDTTHTLHDCRTTFVTMAKEANVDEYAIKYIVGHQIKDITEKVYTARKKDWLKEEIKKIK